MCLSLAVSTPRGTGRGHSGRRTGSRVSGGRGPGRRRAPAQGGGREATRTGVLGKACDSACPAGSVRRRRGCSPCAPPAPSGRTTAPPLGDSSAQTRGVARPLPHEDPPGSLGQNATWRLGEQTPRSPPAAEAVGDPPGERVKGAGCKCARPPRPACAPSALSPARAPGLAPVPRTRPPFPNCTPSPDCTPRCAPRRPLLPVLRVQRAEEDAARGVVSPEEEPVGTRAAGAGDGAARELPTRAPGRASRLHPWFAETGEACAQQTGV